MDDLHKVKRTYRRYLITATLGVGFFAIVGTWAVMTYLQGQLRLIGEGGTILVILGSGTGVALFCAHRLISPLDALWQAILHLNPTIPDAQTPTDPAKLRVGRELIVNLSGQLYQLSATASASKVGSENELARWSHNFIANCLPVPLIVLDATETIQFVNQAASDYIGMSGADLVGKNVYMELDMLFPSESTFDTWLKGVKANTATATASWERVRVAVNENHPERLFDLATYYNRDNAQKAETLLVLFDHTKQYSQDDQSISFMALSVHELRTPLTLLRGYIEVFDEELSASLSPDLKDFMQKMKAASEQLTSFVNNILNVARVDDDQLQLKLQEEDWGSVLTRAVDLVSLRAQVRGINISVTIAPNIPPVGIDRLSIQEVINNLIDNAIKYSAQSKEIKVTTGVNSEGLIETAIQDFGGGISPSVLPNLFTKFYRDHRNRAQIGGTGLGLYLSKAIITAHGGNLWVRSKEGQGSIFGFTVQPFTAIAQEAKDNNQEIVRGAHGWIKNHSLYRR